jgi:hypothetical protein
MNRLLRHILTLINKRLLILLFTGQLLFLLFAFGETILHLNSRMLCNYNDGIRQYFFFISYIRQAADAGWLKVHAMGYPFGEYLLYTDATPGLAILVKLFSHFIADISAQGVAIFNLFLILGQFLSSYFLYLIFKRLGISHVLILLFALLLPWLSIEFLKIIQGHLNLSLTWIIPGAIWLLIRIADSVEGREKRKLILRSLQLGGFMLMSAFIHFYWLALIAALSGFFLSGLWVRAIFRRRDGISTMLALFLSTLLPVLVTLAIYAGLDGYYDERQAFDSGYGWSHWILQFPGLYLAQEHHTLTFLAGARDWVSYGSFAYLGNFALYFLTVWALLELIMRFFPGRVKRVGLPPKTAYPFWLFLGIAAFFSLMISLGEQLPLFGRSLVITNFLNPFYYIHLFTPRITQIRDVSRFSFVLFWAINLFAVYGLDRLLKEMPSGRFIRILAVILIGLAVSDTVDVLRLARRVMNRPNLLQEGADKQLEALQAKTGLAGYQAILPIPYNHEGAGDIHFVIDGFDDFLTQSLRFQLATGLPLMSAKFSRGNATHARQLFSLFSPDSSGTGISPVLLEALDERPVLVLQNEDYYNGKLELTGNRQQPAWDILQNCHRIISRYGMREVAREGNLVLYSWDVQTLRAIHEKTKFNEGF